MKMRMMSAVGVAMFAAAAVADAGQTFDAVKEKGFVQCGVSTGLAGFSMPDSQGKWTGLDIDMCRAVAAAMFGDASAFKVTPLTTVQRFAALQTGEIDVLTRVTTQTLTRDTTLGLTGTGVNFYDGEGIMVKKDLGVKSAKELDGVSVCIRPGTTTELSLADYFRSQNMAFQPVVVDELDETVRAFISGRCDAFTSDKSLLVSIRTTLPDPESYVVLPETLSKEPLGPMVRQGDQEWFNLVRWSLFAMIEAEEYGITSENVTEMLTSADPNVQRILGITPGMGRNLGVNDRWAFHIVEQVGNYGESFDRNVGKDSPLGLERGINATWRNGGLMYGWPIR